MQGRVWHGLWKQFAELGFTGICIPESHGGLGLGATESALVLEEIGRNLTPSPFLSTAVVGARAIEGTAHAERWYPGILSGETVLALAVDEGQQHAPGARRSRPGGRATASFSTARSSSSSRAIRRHDRHRRANRRIARRNRRPYPLRRSARCRGPGD